MWIIKCCLQTFYGDLELAKDEVRLGRSWAAVHIRANFSDALRARVEYGKDAQVFDIDSSTVDVFQDISSKCDFKYLSVEKFQICVLQFCLIQTAFIDFVHSILSWNKSRLNNCSYNITLYFGVPFCNSDLIVWGTIIFSWFWFDTFQMKTSAIFWRETCIMLFKISSKSIWDPVISTLILEKSQ